MSWYTDIRLMSGYWFKGMHSDFLHKWDSIGWGKDNESLDLSRARQIAWPDWLQPLPRESAKNAAWMKESRFHYRRDGPVYPVHAESSAYSWLLQDTWQAWDVIQSFQSFHHNSFLASSSIVQSFQNVDPKKIRQSFNGVFIKYCKGCIGFTDISDVQNPYH